MMISGIHPPSHDRLPGPAGSPRSQRCGRLCRPWAQRPPARPNPGSTVSNIINIYVYIYLYIFKYIDKCRTWFRPLIACRGELRTTISVIVNVFALRVHWVDYRNLQNIRQNFSILDKHPKCLTRLANNNSLT